MSERLLTPTEVAEVLKVTERTVYGWLRQGQLPGRKFGRLWRVPADALDRYVRDEQPEEPLSPEDLAAVREGLNAIRRGEFTTLQEYDRR